jgi:hypothetical protein
MKLFFYNNNNNTSAKIGFKPSFSINRFFSITPSLYDAKLRDNLENKTNLDTNIYTLRKIVSDVENTDKFTTALDTEFNTREFIPKIVDLLSYYHRGFDQCDITLIMTAHKGLITVYGNYFINKSINKNLTRFVTNKLALDITKNKMDYPIDNIEI